MNAAPLPAPLDLTGQLCLVTGGSGGIGQAVCARMHAAGATVIVHYLRNAAGAQQLAASLGGAANERILVRQANLARDDEVLGLIDGIAAEHGRIHTILHCASLGTFKPLVQTRPSHWDLTMAVHTRALWLLASRAPEHMAAGGCIIAMSSLGASRFTPCYGAVGVAKAALEGLVRYLAAELSGGGFRVNGVAGGPVLGERLQQSPAHAAMVAAAAARPGGRFGDPAELADVALFLASPLARWIQGQVIVVDGGFSLW
jgi:enoyl-[acyl-carrier protein] reductase III